MRLEQFWWFRASVPAVVLVLLAYASWGYCYELCYNEIHQKLGQKSVAVGLICGAVTLALVVIFAWIQLVILGPGKQPKVLPFRILPDSAGTGSEDDQSSGKSTDGRAIETIVPPRVYQCDPQGYPLWCTACQSIKANRAHHSSTLGYCVPRFDHYCMWIGTVVGRRNYRLFVQYSLYLWGFCILVIASTASYLPRIIASRKTIPRVNPNILVVLALSCMVTLMVGPLSLSHIYYMSVNRTSLEVIATKRRSKATKNWICYLNETDGMRYVFEFKALDAQDYWNKHNVLRNLKEFLGAHIWLWLVPVGSNVKYHQSLSFEYEDALQSYIEEVSDSFLETLQNRIANGDYLTTFRAYGDQTSK
ncbi:LAME_0H11276g1_1 [Lachancea meyersii CBS 8951]|uniref:Palmitoyltransferase n=1 Tax=Lachancea meyersii CBS 8951 TaxID=1266667 RepID=A0A1G4KGL2_9SACH|nr:LAME_0H11276g1_1 [Lachancea meyersii CBS 8951]